MSWTNNERYRLVADVNSLFKTCQEIHGKGARLNFEIIKDALPAFYGPENVDLDPHAYIVTHPNNTHTEFKHVLEAIGYNVHELQMMFIPHITGAIYDDWSLRICIDLIKKLGEYDVATLVVGETDYSALVEYLTDQGKKVYVLSFETGKVKELYSGADELFFLENEAVYVKGGR